MIDLFELYLSRVLSQDDGTRLNLSDSAEVQVRSFLFAVVSKEEPYFFIQGNEFHK